MAGCLTLPNEIEKRRKGGTLVVGEVGDEKPDAYRERVDKENFAVVLTSGMMHFYYALGRALAGDIVVHTTKDGALNEKPLKPGDSAGLVAKTFQQWRKHVQPSFWDGLWRQERIEHATFPLTDGVMAIAERLVTGAELFMIAHEFGHVMLDLGLAQSSQTNEESRADEAALPIYLASAEERVTKRMAWAGVGFAIRVVQSLANSGVSFPGYPPGGERLETIRAALHLDCASTQYCDEASTIMVAYLDQMDHVDGKLGHLSKDIEAEWQTRVRMMAVLEEVARQRAPLDAFDKLFQYTCKRVPEERARAVAKTLQAYYSPTPVETAYLGFDLRLQMAKTLKERVETMPPELRAMFDFEKKVA